MGMGKSYYWDELKYKGKYVYEMKEEKAVSKESKVACRLPARANRRKNAEPETDALSCKWPPQGKKQ